MYKVIHEFLDLQDTNYYYHDGDVFPHDNGVMIASERIKELSSENNKIGVPLIAEEKKPKRKRSGKSDA